MSAWVQVTRVGVRVDVVLDRPSKLNALTHDSLDVIAQAFDDLADDVRVVVVRSTTPRAFCAGADLVEHRASEAPATFGASLRGARAIAAIGACRSPVIAQIAGHCLGGGFELALGCDIRVAAESSTFAFPEVRLGHLPAWGGVPKLVDLVGTGRALDLLISGRTITAGEAGALGLVEHVVPDDELAVTVDRLAASVVDAPQLAVTAAKLAVAQAAPPRASVLTDALGAGFFQSVTNRMGM